jgi:hypothetical protein
MKNAAALCAALVLAAAMCACGSSTPTSPAPQALVAAVAISVTTASVETTSSGLLYRVGYQLRETSGRSAATFNSIAYALNNGRSTDGALNGTVKVSPGGSLNVGPVELSDNSGLSAASSVTVNAAFTDDTGHSGTSSGSAPITPLTPLPPPVTLIYAVSGTVTDGFSHGTLPSIRVELANGSGAVSVATTTDANGTYRLPGIPPGAYTVSAFATSYLTTSKTIVVGSSDVRVDLVLPREDPGASPSTLTCNGATVPSLVTCSNNDGIMPPTVECNDGAFSCSTNRSSPCASHGGVKCWVCPGPLCR